MRQKCWHLPNEYLKNTLASAKITLKKAVLPNVCSEKGSPPKHLFWKKQSSQTIFLKSEVFPNIIWKTLYYHTTVVCGENTCFCFIHKCSPALENNTWNTTNPHIKHDKSPGVPKQLDGSMEQYCGIVSRTPSQNANQLDDRFTYDPP